MYTDYIYLNSSAQHYHLGGHHGEFRVKNGRQYTFFQANSANLVDIYIVVHYDIFFKVLLHYFKTNYCLNPWLLALAVWLVEFLLMCECEHVRKQNTNFLWNILWQRWFQMERVPSIYL